MKKTSIVSVLVFALLVAFASVAIAQMAEKGWKKTVTLPSGEVILDMSGEWDVLYEYYGAYGGLRPSKGIMMVTQEGKTFKSATQSEGRWFPKGEIILKGELDKAGFKAVSINRPDVGWVPCTWEISENGNIIVFDDGRVITETYTRK